MLWGRGQKQKALAARFVAALNAHDLGAMGALMADDFTYIDSLRAGITGRDRALAGLETVFVSDPGFGVEVEQASYSAPFVLMSGWFNSDNPVFGRRKSVWRVRCDGNRVAEWQSWAEGALPSLTRMYDADHAVDMSDAAARGEAG